MSSKKINLSLNRDIKQPILKNFFTSKVKSQDNSNSSQELHSQGSSSSSLSKKKDWINTEVFKDSTDSLSASIVCISDSDEGTPIKYEPRKLDSDDDMFESTSRDSCSYASKKNVAKMLEQYESPVKQQVGITVKLTPEDKLHFREAQESDPKFLDANRKLEESLKKCNGSKFRFILPQNKTSTVTSLSNEKNSNVDVSAVNLNLSHDEFDEIVAAKNCSPKIRKEDSLEDEKTTKSPTDSSRLSVNGIDKSLEEQIETATLNDNTKYSSTKDSPLSGFSKITEIDSASTTKPSDKGKNTKKFVFRTATASKAPYSTTEIKNVDSVQKKPNSNNPISKSKNVDNDKYDVDTVLRELSHENHLPVGANRTRPNSPLKNTHELTKKPSNRPVVQQKEMERITLPALAPRLDPL